MGADLLKKWPFWGVSDGLLVARDIRIVEARGSNPLCSTLRKPSKLAGFRTFLSFGTIVSTIIEFQTAPGDRMFSAPAAVFLRIRDKNFSVLADQRLQLVCGLLLHVIVAVTVDIQREGHRGVAKRFGERLRIHMALQ